VGEGPSYSLRGKFYNAKGNENPGPGQYSLSKSASVYDSSPAYNFGREMRGGVSGGGSVESVGPGMYHSPLKPSPPLWSFGTEKRGKDAKATSPGPGQYNLKATVPDVPAYLLSSS